MARKERNDIDYFPHPVSHGKKMFYLRSKFKNDGYAVWFMLLEELGKSDYHYLDLSDKIQIMYLSSQFFVNENMLLDIINVLVDFGEFDGELWKHGILFNQKFIDNISDAYKKRSNECIDKKSLLILLRSKGLPIDALGVPNEPTETFKGIGNTQRKEEESKVNKSKVEREQKSAFAPPSQEDVFIFFKGKIEKSNWTVEKCGNEAEKFINFYDSKNWYVGKNKMSLWTSAASGWISKDRAFDFKMEPKNKKDNEFPDYYDRKYEAKLDTLTCQKYHQHLKKNNWEPVFANEGYIANWRKTM